MVDEANIANFRNGTLVADAEYEFNGLAEGAFSIPVHQTGKTYVVVSNSNNYVNYVEVEYDAEMVDGADFNGVSTYEGLSFQLYPNPATERVQLAFTADPTKALDVQFFDLSGKVVLTTTVDDAISSVDVTTLRPGVYFVKCDNHVVKFIKQ